MRNFQKRFGNFMIMVGVVFIVFFFLSDYLGQVNGWYLLIGVLLVSLGASLAWKGRDEPKPSRRFRMLRRMSGGEKGSGRKKRSGRDKDDDDEEEDKDR